MWEHVGTWWRHEDWKQEERKEHGGSLWKDAGKELGDEKGWVSSIYYTNLHIQMVLSVSLHILGLGGTRPRGEGDTRPCGGRTGGKASHWLRPQGLALIG